MGRFLQRDPIGYWDSNNLYQYVLNSPTNFIDPTGEGLEEVFGPGLIIVWITILLFTMQQQQTQTCPPTTIDVPEWIPISIPLILPLLGLPPMLLSEQGGSSGFDVSNEAKNKRRKGHRKVKNSDQHSQAQGHSSRKAHKGRERFKYHHGRNKK